MTDKDQKKDEIEIKQIKIEKWIKILGVFCAILIVIGLVAAIAGSSWFDLRSDKGLEQFGNFAAGTVAAIWAFHRGVGTFVQTHSHFCGVGTYVPTQ